MGCPALCCAVFALACAYMAVTWEKDLNSPRFMLSAFVSNMNNTLTTVRSNRQTLLYITVSALCETSILIFTFYWAPWMSLIAAEKDQHLPYEIIFSSFVLASMLGNYLYQMLSKGSDAVLGAPESTFQGILVVSAGAYLLGSIFQTAQFALLVSVVVQLCVGVYWPCIGYFRGRILLNEQRGTVLVLTRYDFVIASERCVCAA